MGSNILYDNFTAIPSLHNHFWRPRIDKMLEDAIPYPLVAVTAGAGYGKTQAVAAFLKNHEDIVPIWLSLSKLDNLSMRFWESFVYAVNVQDAELSSALHTIGFPYSAQLFDLFLHKMSDALESVEKLVLIVDDFHLISEPAVIQFIGNLLSARLKNLSIILISRTQPQLDVQGLYTGKLTYRITEADLCFTLEEAKGYFTANGISLQDGELYEIHSETKGWIFPICLVLLSIKKDETAASHALTAVKQKIYELIEQKIFIGYSPETQKILIKLSFLESASVNISIIKALSDDGVNLIEEVEKANHFIQYDPFTQSYRIHHLFLEFLSSKQGRCTEKETEKVYYTAAQWYHGQGAVIDSLGYYQKCGHYEEIWGIIRCYDVDIPLEEAELLLSLIEEFPEDILTKYPLAGVVHGRLLLNNGRLEESRRELSKIKEAYEVLPPTPENRAVLGETCIFLAMVSLAMRDYDFVGLFKMADSCLPDGSTLTDNRLYLNNGNYSVSIDSPSAGELEKFKAAVNCAMPHASRAMNGCCCGAEYLTLAEAAYYTGDMAKAVSNAYETIYKAKQQRQNDLVCVAYFALIRASIAKGRYPKASGFLEELTEVVEKPDSVDCLSIIDIIRGWYYAKLGDLDKVPAWILKEEQSDRILSPNRTGRDLLLRADCLLESGDYYKFSAFTKHLEELYSKKSFLIPKLKTQVYKCIAARKIGDTEQSVTALRAAYDLAHGNSIIMPFVEMGKYMRAVCDDAKRREEPYIPGEWLDMIHAKAGTYGKYLSSARTQHKNSGRYAGKDPYSLTAKEKEILQHLCQGLTRKEIADTLRISTSTVKATLREIYGKMGAANSAEAVSIAIYSGLDNSK